MNRSVLAARKFINQLGNISKGFYKVFLETKSVLKIKYGIRSTKSKSVNGTLEYFVKKSSRKEYELIRNNGVALRKLAVYFILQLPPIIGILPVTKNLLYMLFKPNEHSSLYRLYSY